MTRTLRPLAALGIVAIVAVISAGCGGAGGSADTAASDTAAAARTTGTVGTGGGTGLTARDKAVKFSECMRQNGVGDFPDPDASGAFPSFGVSVSVATWTSALRACKALQPPSSLSAHLTPTQFSAALKFARCVREHGVPDFPDPVNGQPLIDTNRIPSANRPGGMAILNAAGHKCAAFIEAAMEGH